MAQEALRQSEARYRAVVEAQSELITRYDRDGRITFANPTYCRFFGKNLEEITATPYAAAVYLGDLTHVQSKIAALTPQQPTQSSMNRNISIRGDVCHIHWTDTALFDAQGQLIEYQAVGRDMTEMVAAQEALRHSEEQLRGLFEQAAVGMCYCDLEGRFLRVNPGLCAITGYAEAEMLQMKFQDITHPEDLSNNLDHKNMLMQGKASFYTIEKRYLRKSGEVVWVLLTVTLLHQLSGEPDSMISVVQDITRHKQTEYNLFEAQKMLTIGTLAGGIAQEITNPLQIITGLSAGLQRDVEGNTVDTGRLRERLGIIHRNAWRVAEVVGLLVNYSRPSTGELEAIDLNKIVRESARLFEHRLKDAVLVNLHIRLMDDLPPVNCDRNQVAQALIKLLDNALEALPEGGDVILDSGYNEDRQEVWLSVNDNGIGISPQVMSKLFDPFFTTKPAGQGRGMGLPLVRSIMRVYGGNVVVDSTPGLGTTVKLCFPLNGSTDQRP